jgi:hypothetical protein
LAVCDIAAGKDFDGKLAAVVEVVVRNAVLLGAFSEIWNPLSMQTI